MSRPRPPSELEHFGIAPGDVVLGKYRVERVLGAGAMGVVVRATHVELGEPVALKLLRERNDERSRARFVREARAAARIPSEHVARVNDVGTLDDGTPFLVMEYLAGVNLARHLRARGALPAAEAVGYALEACEALAYAHGLGIVHRDLKPENLFLSERPGGLTVLKVLDFGVSKVESAGNRDERTGVSFATQPGAIMGSPAYMAPEQWESAARADARSDIWSLGAIMYELVTGGPPFRGDGLPQLCRAVTSEEPAPPSARATLPEGLEPIILRCLEKRPERRYASVGELAQALAPFADAALAGRVARIARVSAAFDAPPSESAGQTGRAESRGASEPTLQADGSLGGMFDALADGAPTASAVTGASDGMASDAAVERLAAPTRTLNATTRTRAELPPRRRRAAWWAAAALVATAAGAWLTLRATAAERSEATDASGVRGTGAVADETTSHAVEERTSEAHAEPAQRATGASSGAAPLAPAEVALGSASASASSGAPSPALQSAEVASIASGARTPVPASARPPASATAKTAAATGNLYHEF